MGDHHNPTRNRGLQPIWMLCLMVIAGSGPLPLWLHDILCHRHASHAHCGEATETAAHQHSACCHSHVSKPTGANLGSRSDNVSSANVASDNVSPANASSTAKQSKQIQHWHAGAHSHEDCAACYTLSQLTTTQITDSVLVTNLALQYLSPASDSQASLQTWSAYSSRGPPAI